MSLTRSLPTQGLDFSPEGLQQALGTFRTDPSNPRSPVVASYVRELETSPRIVINHLLQLTPAQRTLLDTTADTELRADLQPLVDALQAGHSLSVVSIEQVAEASAARTQQQAPTKSQIVITIGRGRCKITISIDL